MTGSGPASILIPIAGTIFLATWLVLVFLADSRSGRARDASAPGRDASVAGREGPGPAVLAGWRQLDAGPLDPADPACTVPVTDANTGTLPAAEGPALAEAS
ncbi:MAG: hypothetical protein JO037_09095 [Actinobacteria bacterium]|nr:hypothetical protein [Actinomycetota bacterium]